MNTTNLSEYVQNPDNPSNATDEDLERLAGKLRRVPIGLTAIRIAYVTDKIADKKMVISGNKRLLVLKRAYGENGEVPAEWFADVTAMTPEQRHEFIVDANISDGEWDLDKLLDQYSREELEELMPETDLAEIFDAEEEIETDGKTDPDSVPSAPEKPISQRGERYALGQHILMCGDSTSTDDLQALMDGEKANLVVTDPPYNVAYEGGTKDKLTIENDSMSEDRFIEFLTSAFNAMSESMAPGSAFYIWHAQGRGGGRAFTTSLKNANLVERETLIWVKNSFTLGRQDYQWMHEPCLYGWKEGAAHYFIDRRDIPTVTEDRVNIQKMKLKELRAFCEQLLARGHETADVIHEPKPARNEDHPTMKPVRLFAAHMKNSSRPGEIVLDIFGGSGTTVIAADQLGRRARVMELDPHYCDVIRKRWAEFVHGEDCDCVSLTPAIEN